MIMEHNNAAGTNKMANFQHLMENNGNKINCIIFVRFVIFIPNVCKSLFLSLQMPCFSLCNFSDKAVEMQTMARRLSDIPDQNITKVHIKSLFMVQLKFLKKFYRKLEMYLMLQRFNQFTI